MILHIPVIRKTVRIDGADRSVLELANGFVTVTLDNQSEAEHDRLQISNPLGEAFIDWFNRGLIGSTERVAIELVELPASNPTLDDNGPSLNHLDAIV